MLGRWDVLVVDPDARCREAIARSLERVGMPVTTVATARDALDSFERATPRIVILEVALPDMTGYELCSELREASPELAILLISERHKQSADRVAGLLIGADDCLAKPLAADELIVRVRNLARRSTGRPKRHYSALTPREDEVIRLLAAGLDQAEIANRLVISPRTVSTHLERIMHKAGVHSRAQAVSWAFKNGLVDAGIA